MFGPFKDCVVHPCVEIIGHWNVEPNCIIEELVVLNNSSTEIKTIGSGSIIRIGSLVSDSVGSSCEVGPFSQINAAIGSHCIIFPRSIVNEPLGDSVVLFSSGLQQKNLGTRKAEILEKHLEFLSNVLPNYH